MAGMSVEELYERHIKPLPPAERMRLIALTAQGLSQPALVAGEPPKRSIMELHGLGAEIWEGIDTQEYVRQLRDEWDHRL
jgi:hypothetical protein